MATSLIIFSYFIEVFVQIYIKIKLKYMLNSPKSFGNHPNSDITLTCGLQEPPHHQETSDLAQNNINYENFYFIEKNPPLYGFNYIDKELSYLDSFLDFDTPETYALYEIKGCMQKSERPLFLTKKIKRNIDNDNNFFSDKTRKKRKSHQKSDFDNILTKIQIHFLNFVINICNDAMKIIIKNQKQYFRPINYEFKRNISYNNIKKLKEISIKEILRQEISNKYKLVSKSINSDILALVTPLSQWLNDFFSINYVKAFSIYYNNCKPLKKINFKGKEIILSSKTKAFNTLLKKNKVLKNNMISAAQVAYFNGHENLTEKFLITRSSEQKKEN